MKCYGVFTFAHDPLLFNVGNTVRSVFQLYFTNKRFDNDNNTIIDKIYLDFECWDSAAEFIVNNCLEGDKIYIEAAPKNDVDGVIFRINTFKVFHV